ACAGHGIDTQVGERRGHDGQVCGGDGDGALARVVVEGRTGVAVDDPPGGQEPGEAAVVGAVGQVLLVHVLVEVQAPAGARGHRVEDAVEDRLPLAGLDEGRRRDGADVDEGVLGAPAAGLRGDVVVRTAGR